MRLRELSKKATARSILVTSALPREGKSTTALNLATILAEEGKRRVLLVDGDLHHSSLARNLGITVPRGLTDCLQGYVDPDSAICRIDPLGWYLLAAGESCSHPTELLQSDAFPALVRKLSADFDWVIFDSAPVIPLTDTVAMAPHIDATLLVAKTGSTPGKAIEDTMLVLGKSRLIGIILNGVENLNREYSEYTEYYGAKLRQD
jgi:capsular exopolysaccharide synthesis family protein